MCIRFIVALAFSLLVSAACYSQADSILSKFTFLKTTYDTNYILKLNKTWEAHLFMQGKNNSFESSNKSRSQSIFFDPLTNLSIGAGGSYENFSLDYGFAVQTNRGDTASATGFDFVTSLYVSQHIFDLGFRHFRGYYVSGYDSASNTLVSLFRDDIATSNLFVNYLYNFNYSRFSLNASFIGNEIQVKSAGAPLLGIFFNYNDVHANESIVPPQFEDSTRSLLPISEANIWTTGVIGGYAYTFVLPLHFYLTLSLVPGIAMSVGEAKTKYYFGIGQPVTPSFKLISKDAFGYSGKNIYGYVAFYTDKNWVRLGENDHYANNLGRWQLLIGYQFD